MQEALVLGHHAMTEQKKRNVLLKGSSGISGPTIKFVMSFLDMGTSQEQTRSNLPTIYCNNLFPDTGKANFV